MTVTLLSRRAKKRRTFRAGHSDSLNPAERDNRFCSLCSKPSHHSGQTLGGSRAGVAVRAYRKSGGYWPVEVERAARVAIAGKMSTGRMLSAAIRGETTAGSKKIQLPNVGTKNNDDDEEEATHRRARRSGARPFLSHNSLCTPVSNNDTARAYLMHCDKEFKESAEERFHPDPSLTTEEAREEAREGRKTAKENARAREAHTHGKREREREREGEGERKTGQRVRPRSSAYPLCGSLAFHVVFRLIGN